MDHVEHSDDALAQSLTEGWKLFSTHLSLFLLAGLVHLVLSVVTLGLLVGPLTLGLIRMVERRRAGEHVEVNDIFSGFSQFVPSLFLTVLLAVFLALGFALLFVPGFVLLCGWMFAFHVMLRDQCGALEAMSRSWELFRSQTSLVLVSCVLLLICNSLGGSVVLGTILSVPFSLICLTLLFERISPSIRNRGR